MADICKDCKVERGYRPMLDYVSLCPLHAAAPELAQVLSDLMLINTPATIGADLHAYAEDVLARAKSKAIRKAGGE